MNKIQMAEQLRKVIQMFAESLDEERAMEVATIYEEWKPNKQYKGGQYVTYGTNEVGDPQLYKIVDGKAHTSQDNWRPDETPSLYIAIGISESGYPVWSAPTGAHDAYNIGDIVSFDNVLYISKINGNTIVPNTDERYWEVYGG
jgi:hypothetical protein